MCALGRCCRPERGSSVWPARSPTAASCPALAPDLGVGRRTRPLGPLDVVVAAPREIVFDVIAGPYLGRTPHAMADSLRVLDRGADLVLAAHYTPLRGGRRATTVETVHFTRPSRVDFRLVRGPVPYVVETFMLTADDPGTTRLVYSGELGTDLGPLGEWWGDRVTPVWKPPWPARSGPSPPKPNAAPLPAADRGPTCIPTGQVQNGAELRCD